MITQDQNIKDRTYIYIVVVYLNVLYFWYDLIGKATGALNDSCQDRSSPVENTVMDDEYEDVAQHFQDIVKW